MCDEGSASADSNEEYSFASGGEDSEDKSEGSSSAESDPQELRLHLIELVRKRPVLWDTRNPDYKRSKKEELWAEVDRELYSSGKFRRPTDKNNKVIKTQKIWKNVKDCYNRDLDKKRKGIKGGRYRYHKKLNFLKPNEENSKCSTYRSAKRKICKNNVVKSTPGTSKCKSSTRLCRSKSSGTTSKMQDDAPSRQSCSGLASCQRSVGTSTRHDPSSTLSGNDPACHKRTNPCTSVVLYDEPIAGPSKEPATPMLTTESGRQKMVPFEAAQLEFLLSKHKEEPDEDKDFASSLVPMLRKLDDDQKHFAKANILNVMKNARHYQGDLSDIPVPGNYECTGQFSQHPCCCKNCPQNRLQETDSDPD